MQVQSGGIYLLELRSVLIYAEVRTAQISFKCMLSLTLRLLADMYLDGGMFTGRLQPKVRGKYKRLIGDDTCVDPSCQKAGCPDHLHSCSIGCERQVQSPCGCRCPSSSRKRFAKENSVGKCARSILCHGWSKGHLPSCPQFITLHLRQSHRLCTSRLRLNGCSKTANTSWHCAAF